MEIHETRAGMMTIGRHVFAKLSCGHSTVAPMAGLPALVFHRVTSCSLCTEGIGL